MAGMNESPESSARPASATSVTSVPSTPPAPKPYWLFRFAAWVGIVAGIVFVVAVIFFSGVRLGHHGGWHGHHHHHHHSMMHRGGQHQQEPAPVAPTVGAPGPGELPQSVTPSPVPPGR